MSDLISLVLPVYNVEKYIVRCIESVLAQTYTHIEIILVDDGSTDKSGIICDEYSKKDDRIKVIHKENGGLSSARNKGLEYITGNYVMFIDSDDVVSCNIVDSLYHLTVDNNADIGICNLIHCYEGEIITYKPETAKRIFTSEEAICEMLYQKSFLVSACGKLYKRQCFDSIRFPYGMLFEDSAVMYRIFDLAEVIVYSNAKLYGYMHREESITTHEFSKKDCDILKICKDIVEYFKDRSVSLQKAAMSYQIVGALRVYINAPDTNEFRNIKAECKKMILKNGKKVALDNSARAKTRIGAVLFLYARQLIPLIYSKVNRWK